MTEGIDAAIEKDKTMGAKRPFNHLAIIVPKYLMMHHLIYDTIHSFLQIQVPFLNTYTYKCGWI